MLGNVIYPNQRTFFCVVRETSYGFEMLGHYPNAEAAWQHSQKPEATSSYVSCFSKLPPTRMVISQAVRNL